MSNDISEARPIVFSSRGEFLEVDEKGVAMSLSEPVTGAEVAGLLNWIVSSSSFLEGFSDKTSGSVDRSMDLSKENAIQDGKRYLAQGLAILMDAYSRDNKIEAEIGRLIAGLEASEVLFPGASSSPEVRKAVLNAYECGLRLVVFRAPGGSAIV